jgi:hypothetical protein
MKPILLGALALPFLLTACGSYVGYDDGYGGPGYYAYGGLGYYDGVYGDVATYGYSRGGYSAHYHHYDGRSSHADMASRGVSHSANFASASHSGGGHMDHGGGASHASASVGGGGRGGRGGDHR